MQAFTSSKELRFPLYEPPWQIDHLWHIHWFWCLYEDLLQTGFLLVS